jgi:hypothetical protein
MAMGVTASGGALVTGSGAFTSAEVDRTVSVDVDPDSQAYLSLVPGPNNGEYINNDNGVFKIDFTDANDNIPGTGLNSDGLFVFEKVFQIRNSGSQEVDVTPSDLAFADTNSGDVLVFIIVPETTASGTFPTVTLGVGEAETYGIVALVDGGSNDSLGIGESITFSAEAT